MVKSIKSIYFMSELLMEAEQRKINVADICNEALRIALRSGGNTGSVEGALGNFLNTQAEKANDIKIIRKLSRNKDEAFNRALRAFAIKNTLSLSEALKEAGV